MYLINVRRKSKIVAACAANVFVVEDNGSLKIDGGVEIPVQVNDTIQIMGDEGGLIFNVTIEDAKKRTSINQEEADAIALEAIKYGVEGGEFHDFLNSLV